MKRQTLCRICSSARLARYLDLGTHPLANTYPSSPGVSSPGYPLAVDRCRDCGHSQLSVVVDPDEMFSDYLWVSGTTETQRRHFAEFAAQATPFVQLSRQHPPSVLDIGCNDGTLLDAFGQQGFVTYGVDPAQNLEPITLAKGHRVLVEGWSPAVAASFRAAHGEVDLITGCNVLAHCDDALGFLLGCHSVLAPGGQVILEFPYARLTLEQHQFDQFYHEHLSYFMVGPFRMLCDAGDFRIVGVKQTPIHGGSIRFTLRPGETGRTHALEVDTLEITELEKGLFGESFYTEFSDRLEARHRQLRSLIDTSTSRGFKLVAYGASAKGNTMFNYWTDVTPNYVVDDNPRKCGRYTPGRGIPIVPGDRLRHETGRLAILLTAWNFADEIRHRLRALGRRGDLLLRYVPVVAVEALT